jgi:predicted phage terminase large subunit-like protein
MISAAAIDRERIRRGGFAEFVKRAWKIAVPNAPLRWNWHHDIMCRHYEAVLRGELKKLVLNVPPGHTKSLITSVFLPAYAWGPGARPGWQAIYASFDIELARRDSTKCKDLVTSKWYQDRWGFSSSWPNPITTGAKAKAVGLDETSKSDSASVWYNSAGGMRIAVSTAGKGTGWHAHAIFVDDPTKPITIKNGGDEARKALTDTREWWSGTMASRRVDPANFAQVVVMQRLHTEDLAGVCVKEGYTHVCLPAEYDPQRHCKTPWGEDPRTVPGELLWPDHVTPEALAELKKDLGRHASAQLNQDPIPEGGSIWKPEWLAKRWNVLPRCDKMWQSWDFTFDGKATSDYVVGQVWGKKGPDFYLVYQLRRRMGFVDTCQAIRDVSKKFPKVRRKLIEAKANGDAIYDTLQREIGGFVKVTPTKSKVARANAASETYESGNVYLPEDPHAFVGDGDLQSFIDEHLKFPMGSNDDQVDAGSQSINENSVGGGAAGLLEAYGSQT